ncbi:MAG: aminotransferase class I/II-fold pyridoxal phosphate-dependent enzyme, partial [Alphaproteobacteria bacterium]|nr:aminotransferase class I/II-fold pyridoxal phosphate-dependent enzyme [Alphaproteobacteria bacterium]
MNPDISKLIRTHYLDLAGYVSAGMEVVKRDDLVFMNANENPYELPDLESYNRYPQPQPQTLLEAYAHTYGCDTDNIIMTRGADEALVILTKLFCEPHKDKVLINPPTFGMYKVDAQSMPAGVVSVPLLKDGGTFVLDKDQIIKQATNESQNIKLVYICSPNNPTGNSFDHKAIIEIVKALCGYAMVVLDETYAEFTAQGSLVPGLQDHPNLIILRTLSKSYSFAGMRMGCFLSGDEDF